MRRALKAASLLTLAALTACAPKVRYGEPIALPILSTSVDPNRWYVEIDGGESIGKTLWFFDSGYSGTTCDDGFAAGLALPKRGGVRIHGEAGVIRGHRSPMPPFTLGGHRVEGATCIVRDLHTTSSIRDPAEVPVAGVLGADLLRPFRVTVDPSVPHLLLEAPSAKPLFDRSDPAVIRLRADRPVSGRPLVHLRLDGRPTRAVVDTGASGTYLDAVRLGLTPTQTASNVAIRGTGTGGEVRRDLAWYEAELELANHVAHVTVTQRDASRGTPGLVGINVLSGLHQTYDFRHHQARFTPVTPAPVPSWRRHTFGAASPTPPTRELPTGHADDAPSSLSPR